MSLSTLIVQREIASIREVEEALARQVLYGGDFVTNLLEVCRLDEAQLLPLVAESLGLPPAPPGELPRPEPDAQRLVAAEVAIERNLAPLSVDRYGLTIAVAEPLSPDVEQELSFALALPISQKIAPLVRIRQALARDYGAPLDRRHQRLLQRMMLPEGPRGGSSFPPMRTADFRLGAPRPPSVMPPAPHSKPPEPVRPSVPPGGSASARTLLRQPGDMQPVLRPQRRRRGAITIEVARAELEEATERDTIFDLLFEFARQYFDYTAVFILHGDLAEGRDSFGDGAPREKVARIGVPLDLPSILSAARDKKTTVQRIPAVEGLDAVLMNDLGRSGRTACVVLPVIVRTRVVALLLGDGGDTGIDLKLLADVEGMVTTATAAFERLIVRRKLKGSVMPGGMGDSILPYGGASAPPGQNASVMPPTMLSEPVRQNDAYELAAPIRDLLTEPESRIGETVREPVVQHYLPPDISEQLNRVRSDKPPPADNVLAVRRPSGRPIPREEPEPRQRVPAVTAPSNLGSAAHQAQAAVRAAAAAAAMQHAGAVQEIQAGPISTGPRSRRRGEAPRLDFGAIPTDSAMFGSETFGSGDEERALLAEIQGAPLERAERISSGPITDRDQHPPAITSYPPIPPSVPSSEGIEPPPSPKAESPPPQKVAARSTTDMSPTGFGPAWDATPPSANDPPSSEMLSADDFDVQVIDPDATPLAPEVSFTPSDAHVVKPIAPGVVELAPLSKPPMTPWPSEMSEPAIPAATPAVDIPSAAAPSAPVFVAAAPASRIAPSVPSSGRPMPASEQQISVAAHRPPSSRSDASRVLPSVIVDVASEYVDLVDRVLGESRTSGHEGAPTAEDAEAELVRAGGYAMPAIMTRFPGPVTIERDRLIDGPLPRVAECGPILRVIASQRRTALPFVLSHVEDPNPEKRFWATYLLTELVYPDVIDPIVARIFDEEPRVRRAARAAARAYAEVQPQAIVERLELVAMDGGESYVRRALAIEALGETRETLAVPALMPLLDDPNPEIASAVRAALTIIARQDFGPASARWTAWWEQNRDRHRIEWLIDALMHEQAALRATAGEELKTITKEYFGYYDDLPKRERERAQTRYREWWNSVGRVRFSRASSSRG